MKVLKSYDWDTINKAPAKARSANYPWTVWFDTEIRVLEQGKDFDGEPASIERVIRTSATRKSVGVRIRTTPEGNVVIQSKRVYVNGAEAATASKPVAAKPAAKTSKPAAKTAKAKPAAKPVAKKAAPTPAKKVAPKATNGNGAAKVTAPKVPTKRAVAKAATPAPTKRVARKSAVKTPA